MQHTNYQRFDPYSFDASTVKTGSTDSQNNSQIFEDLIFDYKLEEYQTAREAAPVEHFKVKIEATAAPKKVNFWRFFLWKFLPIGAMTWIVAVLIWSIPIAAAEAAPVLAITANWLVKLLGACIIVTISIYLIVNMLHNFINSSGSFSSEPPLPKEHHYPTKTEQGGTIINNIQNNYY
jgi:hypothetical protein